MFDRCHQTKVKYRNDRKHEEGREAGRMDNAQKRRVSGRQRSFYEVRASIKSYENRFQDVAKYCEWRKIIRIA